jgi:hypothetical protein
MSYIKNIFDNKYIRIYLFTKAWLLGIGNNSRGDIHFHLPFLIIAIKKDHIPFVRKYGEVIVVLLMVWFTTIILSRILY